MSFPGIIGKKLGMTQVFDEEGLAIPVTVVQVLPMTVTQVKTPEKDGYSAVQVGFTDAKAKHLTKAQQGHLKKNGLPLLRKLKEFRLEESDAAGFKVGDVIDFSFLEKGMLVDVTGTSIGKGFQGNTRRWGHSRGLMSHGSKSHRLPGSIGAGTTPGRVYKGTKMAGNTGNAVVTQQKAAIVDVLPEEKLLLIRGSVPGHDTSTLVVRKTVRQKRAVAS